MDWWVSGGWMSCWVGGLVDGWVGRSVDWWMNGLVGE